MRVDTAPEGEDIARENWSKYEQETPPHAASRIGEDDTVMLCGELVSTFSTYIRNSGPAGMAGLPSFSLPAGLIADGLPVGLELDGPPGTDLRLLAISRAIETVLPAAAVAPVARWVQQPVRLMLPASAPIPSPARASPALA